MSRSGSALAFAMKESECPGGCGKMLQNLATSRFVRRCDECQQLEFEAEEALRSATEAEELADRQRQRIDHIGEYMARAGAPRRYLAYTRETWEAKYPPWSKTTMTSIHGEKLSLEEISQIWLDQENPPDDWLLVIFGEVGMRKTSFGTAVLAKAVEAGEDCRWIDAERWVDDLEYGMRDPSRPNPGWRTTAEVFRDSSKAGRLMIDDLGAIRVARAGRRSEQDWWKERHALQLRERESQMWPTIVNSNMGNLDQLAAINYSLPSRLKAARLAFRVTGQDHRARE